MHSTPVEHEYKIGDVFWIISEYGEIESFKVSHINFSIYENKVSTIYSNGLWSVPSGYMKDCFPTEEEAKKRCAEIIDQLGEKSLQDLEKELEILQKKIYEIKKMKKKGK